MVIFTTPGFWFFLTLVGVSLVVLRIREPAVARPFRVPGYPITPILFTLSSLYMVHAGLDYAWQNRSWEALWSIAILLVGIVVVLLGMAMNFWRCPEQSEHEEHH
jgi:amino acid transporter